MSPTRSSVVLAGIVLLALALRLIFVTQAAATGVLHDLVLDVAQYEAFARHVRTRVPVCVEGRLQWDRWEQDGQARSRLLIPGTPRTCPARTRRGRR